MDGLQNMEEIILKRPNIVFFFSDQQRYDTLGINGQKLPVTPNLDRLSEEGVNFDRAYTVQPVCGPARACLQTGMYATQTGCFCNGVSLPEHAVTLGKLMKDGGYHTAYVGKWHLASDDHGEDFHTLPVPERRRGGYEYWMAADVLEFTSHGYGGYVYDGDGNKVTFDGYRADCITDYALDFIRESDSGRPFFLFLSHIEPHHQNDREDFEGPLGSRERFGGFEIPDDLRPGEGDWERFMPDYLGCCHSLDRNFGRIVELLKEKGIYEDTLLIYASDHGCHFRTIHDVTEGGYDDYKRNSFENTIHIPMVMKGPGLPVGEREKHLVSLLDIPVTILSAAGIPVPEEMQGRDLRRIYCGETWEDEVYIQISESYVGRALRTAKYKYVVHAPDKDPGKDMGSKYYAEKYLFDLEKDPLERMNLIDDAGYKQIKESLRQRLVEKAYKAGEGVIHIRE